MELSDNGREANEALSYNGRCCEPCFRGLIKYSNRGLCQGSLCLRPVGSSRSYPFWGLDFISHWDVSVVADLEFFFSLCPIGSSQSYPFRGVVLYLVGESRSPPTWSILFVPGRIVSVVSIPGPLKFVYGKVSGHQGEAFEVRAEVGAESSRGESFAVNLRWIKRSSVEEVNLLVDSPWLFSGTPPSSAKMLIAFFY